VPRHVRLRELLIGVEGLALLRELFTGNDESAQRRIDEVRRLVGDEQAELYELGADTPELEVTEGYTRWSTTYDADYLDAFAAVGLAVRRCIESEFGPAEVEMQQPAWRFIPAATAAANLGLPAALVWQLTVSA
jgi:hypothetical protein